MSLRFKLFVLINVASSSFAQSDVCKEGLYGKNCELTCSDTCRPFQTFPCDKKSGQCSEGCKEGYYGDQCDKTCSCAPSVCYQATGECIESDETSATPTKHESDIIGSTTEAVVDTPVSDGAAAWRVISFILIVFLIILSGFLVGMCLYARYLRRDMKKRYRTASGTSNRRFLDILPCFSCIGGNATGEEQTSEIEMLDPTKDPTSQENNDEEKGVISEETKKTVQVSEHQESEHAVKKHPKDKESLTQKIKDLEQLLNREKEENDKLRKKIGELDQLFNGTKKENDELEKKIGELEEKGMQTLKNLGLPENSTHHLMKIDPSWWLQCTHMEFDKETVNVSVAYIDDNMVLWNIPDRMSYENNSKRFQEFSGTTCTQPLVVTGFYQYFEAVFNINLKQTFEDGEIVKLLGFCEEKDRDQSPFTPNKAKSFIVKAVGCTKHRKICLVYIQDGKANHIKELMANEKGSKAKVNLGVRLNKELSRLGLYELEPPKVLLKTDVKIGENIWPMFGLCAFDKAIVNVTLEAGRDIRMCEKKKETITPKDKKMFEKKKA